MTEASLLDYLIAREEDLVFLCGAGISVPPPSCLPSVAHFLREAADVCTSDSVIAAELLRVSTDPAIAPRFEVLIDEIRKWNDPNLKIAQVFNSFKPNGLHAFLAERCRSGAAVITTNFDLCIESVADESTARIVFEGCDLRGSPASHNVLVKPHGSHSSMHGDTAPSLLITIAGIAETANGYRRFPAWRRYLRRLIKGRTLVILGYSCSDAFDLVPLLMRSRPELLLFVDYDPTIEGVTEASTDLASSAVGALCRAHPSRYFRGQFAHLVPGPRADLQARRVAPTVRECIEAICTGPSQRHELLNLLLLVHNLNHAVSPRRGIERSVETLLQTAKAQYRLSHYDNTLRVLDRASRIPRSDRQDREYLYYLASTLYHIGRTAEAYSVGRHHYFLTKRTADVRATQFSLNNLGGLATGAGRDCRARAHYEACLRLTDRVPNLEAEATARWGLGDLFARERRMGDSQREYRASLEIHRSLGNRIWVAYLIRNLGEVFVDHHRFEDAEEQLKIARREFQELANGAGQIWTAYSLSKLAYLTNDDQRCARELSTAMSLIGSGNLFPVLPELIAVAALLAGRGEDGPLRTARRKFLRKLTAAESDVRKEVAVRLLQSRELGPTLRADAYHLAFVRGE